MNFTGKWVGVLMGAIISVSYAADPRRDEFNPYEHAYVSRAKEPDKPQGIPKLFAGTDKVADYYLLLEDGYDLLGYSSFESGDVPPEQALTHAAKLNADLVLVYHVGIDNLANLKARRGSGVEKGHNGTLYEYFASYWFKLPMPLLGLHVQRERPDEDAGLEVLAVVKQSPAAVSGLQRGDVLTRIGDVELHQPEQLAMAAQRYSGQSVEIIGRRDDVPFKLNVTLNRR